VPGAGLWVGFVATVAPLVVTPGASLTLLVQRVTADGRRQALPVVGGTVSALAVYAVVVLGGMTTLVGSTGPLRDVLRVAGAAYLVGLGCWMWWSTASDHTGSTPPTPPTPPAPRTRRSGYAQALLGTLLNPKAALIYLTVLPRFVDPDRPWPTQLLTLTATHATLVACWLLAWTAMLGPAERLTGSPRWRSRITRASATVLVVIGVRWLVG
jgi:threonine/homoserine/homoserine lactone efflux protein